MVTGSNKAEIEEFKLRMKSEFEMTDLGKLAYFLGIKFMETSRALVMHQEKYAT